MPLINQPLARPVTGLGVYGRSVGSRLLVANFFMGCIAYTSRHGANQLQCILN